jgi:hypothetical protein
MICHGSSVLITIFVKAFVFTRLIFTLNIYQEKNLYNILTILGHEFQIQTEVVNLECNLL